MNSNSRPRLIAIWGPPRSGTTWLGQIFDSHPAVAYRFQPLFSYRFKGAVTEQSSPEVVERFLADLLATDDDFIRQTSKRAKTVVPTFEKSSASHLVFKEVRYLHLISHFLGTVPDSHAVGILRHPCATINSWLKTPREFRPEWDVGAEWRGAPSKNLGRIEEYFGFERWKWVAEHFLHLAQAFPDRFTLVRYEDLVELPTATVASLFARCGLASAKQTADFLRSSQAEEFEHPDSVFRKPEVKDRWRRELPADIREVILAECRGSKLETFCL